MKYILVTFHRHEYDGGKVVYRVYGHVGSGINNQLCELESRELAIDYSFRYGLPVMEGLSYGKVLSKLD